MQCNYLAGLLYGSSGSHLLWLVFAICYCDCGSAPSDRDPSCYFLQRKISTGKRSFSGPFSVGLSLVLLWREKTQQEKATPPRDGNASNSQSMIQENKYFPDFPKWVIGLKVVWVQAGVWISYQNLVFYMVFVCKILGC